MNSPRDEVDRWLDDEVAPLYPKSGSLDRIRGQARRRKRRQAILTAAGCALVVAAAVSVPQLISTAQHGGARPAAPIAGSQTLPVVRPSASASGASGRPDATQHTQVLQHTTLTTGSSGTVPPRNFRPTSVTVVGTGSGGLVGAVIGQAGPPCYNPGYCTSLAGTSSYGTRWYGVSAPVATGPDGPAGVSQLRFANLTDGWAFGPALYETSGGGWPWNPESTYGLRVTDLEAAGQNALAVFASCAGTGAAYAGDCTSFTLYHSVAGSTAWMPVAVPAGFAHVSDGQPSSASLVISGGKTGYVLTPTGAIISGPVSGASWHAAGQAPCRPGQAQADGAPASAQLAAGPELMLACDTVLAGGAQQTILYASSQGARWTNLGAVPHAGAATALASASAGQAVLATTAGIYYSADGGKSWNAASFGGQVPAGGFSYAGMTNATQGVAVPANSALGEIFVTSDGGRTWTPSPITGG